MWEKGYERGTGRVAMFAVAVTTTPVQVVPRNPDRRGLLISPPVAGTLYVSWDPNASGTNGIAVTLGQYPLQISLMDGPAMVTQELYAWLSAGSGTFIAAEESWQ